MDEETYLKGMLDEVQYWKQIFDDLTASSSDLELMTDQVVLLIPGSSTLLVKAAQGDKEAQTLHELIVSVVDGVFLLIQRSVERNKSTASLAEGRLRMLE